MKATFRPLRTRGPAAAALLLAGMLAGCSSVVDNVPQALGGLPPGTPQRAATPPAYPSVHDMPAAREDAVLSEAEAQRLRQELKNTRTRISAPTPPPEATGSNAGSARNP
jgi:hypothetical protein